MGKVPPKIRSRPSLSFLYVKNSIARTRKRKILRAKERRSGGQDANGNGEIGRVVTDKTDWQQVPHPGSIFANNDAGQARFLGLKTPASKWGGERSSQIFRKISVDPRSSAAEKVLRLLLLRTENRELLSERQLAQLERNVDHRFQIHGCAVFLGRTESPTGESDAGIFIEP